MPVSLKIAHLEQSSGMTADVDQISTEIAERMVVLAHAGADIDRAVERAYRILAR